jgi:dienelactone hydrolase
MRRAVGIAALILGCAAPAAARAADPDCSVGTKLTGRLDLDHIGLMGHSKGGEAVSRFLELNVGRQPQYNIDGVVALAPSDSGNQAPGERAPGTNWAVLLPACDGDVFDVQGGNAFERAKAAPQGRRFAKFQWLVAGTNHDWFNTVWYQEDHDVRIPLARFPGVDLHRLAGVELRFGVRGRPTGSIELADMALQ